MNKNSQILRLSQSTSVRREHATPVRVWLLRRILRLGIVVLAFVGLLFSAVPSGASGNRATAPFSSYSVGIARCTFVDYSRSALNYSTIPYSSWSTSRTLVTEVRYPIAPVSGVPRDVGGAPPLVRNGGYPLVVFAHGYDVTPDRYGALLDSWARAGFVVAAPFFPDEQPSTVAAQHGVNTEGDLANEPADLAFVTRSLLTASAGTTVGCRLVSGLINPADIALAGHSDGATAVAMLAYDHGNDPQGNNYTRLRTGLDYRAVIILSGAQNTAQPFADEISHPDLLVIHSLADQCNPFHNGVTLYRDVHQINRWFLELQHGHHLPPFDGADRVAFPAVATTTTSFLEMALSSQIGASTFTQLARAHPLIARLFSGGAVPTPPRTSLPLYCGRN